MRVVRHNLQVHCVGTCRKQVKTITPITLGYSVLLL